MLPAGFLTEGRCFKGRICQPRQVIEDVIEIASAAIVNWSLTWLDDEGGVVKGSVPFSWSSEAETFFCHDGFQLANQIRHAQSYFEKMGDASLPFDPFLNPKYPVRVINLTWRMVVNWIDALDNDAQVDVDKIDGLLEHFTDQMVGVWQRNETQIGFFEFTPERNNKHFVRLVMNFGVPYFFSIFYLVCFYPNYILFFFVVAWTCKGRVFVCFIQPMNWK